MRIPSIALAVALAATSVAAAQDKDKRPMTFLDMQLMRQVGAPAPSPDGRWMLYTVSTPDWKEAKTPAGRLSRLARAGPAVDASR